MAQRTGESGGDVTADPDAIRARMAQTRADLEKKLGKLKSRLLDRPHRKRKKDTVTQKKTKATAGKKKTTAAAKKTMKKVVRKTKKVAGEMLVGAAVGAVKGAAEAVMPDDKSSGKDSKSEE